MKFLLLCAALTTFALAAVTPALAYDERPMRLPATGTGASAASTEPSTWLVAAESGSARADAIARRFGARKLRLESVYRVARSQARGFAAALKGAGMLRYAEPNAALSRSSAFDVAPTGYARGLVVEPGVAPPPPGTAAVAIVDDLVDITHPDLAGHTFPLTAGPVLGPHGTMVASAAAGSFQGTGVFGMFPGAPIISVGLPVDITCGDAANGILAAAAAGAKVINLSFGSPNDCASLFGTVQVAYARGSLVVASAGNEFAGGNPVIYPAAYPHVLSVAALNPDLTPSGFSSENTAVDVAAPGFNIPLAIPVVFDVEDGVADGITLASGTSFSSPIVAGAAAWLATVRPTLSNGQLADVLRRSARDVHSPGYDPATGYGIIQMGAAILTPEPEPDLLEPNDGISFINGSVFAKPDPYVWKGTPAKRTFGGSVDRVEDPIDVYRVRLPARSRARIRVRPSFGNPDLFVFRGSAKSVGEDSNIIARSKKATGKVDSVTLSNRGRSAKRFYLVIPVGDDAAGSLNASYRLEFARIRRAR
jgi:hypothetical protein